MIRMDLQGLWKIQLDSEKRGIQEPIRDTIQLPGTTSYWKMGERNSARETHFLTDAYKFEGYAWFEREIYVTQEHCNLDAFLFLERTRKSTLWMDGEFVGFQDSLSTPHLYRLPKRLTIGKHTIRIRIDNTQYPTKGGHLTSQDTQSNWNGITGRIELQFSSEKRLEAVKVESELIDNSFRISGKLVGCDTGVLRVQVASVDGHQTFVERVYRLESSRVEIEYILGEGAVYWSEFNPYLYNITLSVEGGESTVITTGLRSFVGGQRKFLINGFSTFLRGKHDGLIFPLTGYAPTDVESWLKVMSTAKAYGINHYRFHTCCPPKAAFEAADKLGIYMQPELPFWGTIYGEGEEGYNAEEHQYLVDQGFKILDTFGNHPSFVMMSLGNELWGDHDTIDRMLKSYKDYDRRHMYTQGSNNFQFMPVVLEQDDFFCGVRFSKEKLIRGSYAMCDAPQGHIQTEKPSTIRDYDWCFEDAEKATLSIEDKESMDTSIEIQYGTGMKKVTIGEQKKTKNYEVPVISHEIGQYQTFPNFDEIEKYSGPLKARNFQIFKERLESKNLEHLSRRYFENSGRLAVACYKEEIEAAIRTKNLAGFQLLDLQDFSGQGTALVGVLDAFMDTKGLVELDEWQSYCSDLVLLGRFDNYCHSSGDLFNIGVQLAVYRPIDFNEMELKWVMKVPSINHIGCGEVDVVLTRESGVHNLCDLVIELPEIRRMAKATVTIEIPLLNVTKSYTLWIHPLEQEIEAVQSKMTDSFAQVKNLLCKGETVIYFPKIEEVKASIEGAYCTDFWCYPMFRSISEGMGKAKPIGTMGLCIDTTHSALNEFACETYTTPQWHPIIDQSRLLVMDKWDHSFNPIVQMIDNFERNHKLSVLVDYRVGDGHLIICMPAKEQLMTTIEGRSFLSSIIKYADSGCFVQEENIAITDLDELFISS